MAEARAYEEYLYLTSRPEGVSEEEYNYFASVHLSQFRDPYDETDWSERG